MEEVNEISVFAARIVCPFTGSSLAMIRQADGKTLTFGAGCIADLPVVALLGARGEKMTTKAFSSYRQVQGEFVDVVS
jgi:hypothetical protein